MDRSIHSLGVLVDDSQDTAARIGHVLVGEAEGIPFRIEIVFVAEGVARVVVDQFITGRNAQFVMDGSLDDGIIARPRSSNR